MGPKGTSITHDSSRARASADLPLSSNKPISPKRSPFSIRATTDSLPMNDLITMAMRQESTRKRESGLSFSRNKTSPLRRSLLFDAFTIISSSFSSNSAKSIDSAKRV